MMSRSQPVTFEFPRPSRSVSYAETISMYHRGLLTCGFLWALATSDDVFAAYLRRLAIPHE